MKTVGQARLTTRLKIKIVGQARLVIQFFLRSRAGE